VTGHNISPVLLKPIMSVVLFSSFFRLHRQFILQTLTTMYLGYNRIGVEGAQHLADAFQNNKVSFLLSLTI
jgi:hypothetical protein